MVDMRQQLPPEWAERAERRGLSPSATAIAKAAGLATSTVTRMLAGRFSSTASINAVAKVLGVKPSVIADEVGVRIHSELGMWEPPKEAHQLGGAERDVLNRLIGVLAKGEDDAGGQPKDQKSPGGGSGGASVTKLPERRHTTVEDLADLPSVASTPSDEERARRKAEDESVAHIDDENQDSGDWEE